jgi:hypothetical protein
MSRGWACTHGKLSEARCAGPGGHLLTVHVGWNSVDLCRDVLIEGLVRAKAGVRMVKLE